MRKQKVEMDQGLDKETQRDEQKKFVGFARRHGQLPTYASI
jgi:hypothetical protein